MSAARQSTLASEIIVDFPEGYPEMLDHIGQVIARGLVKHGTVNADLAKALAFRLVEDIRVEVGGQQSYIPRGLLYELSVRDEEIFDKFKGDNYSQLAHEYRLTEMQLRTIIKRGIARARARTQTNLF